MAPLEQVIAWKKEGRTHVSSNEAAKVLHCSPEGLRKAAHDGQLGLAFFFSGKHLCISVQGILNFLEGRNFPEAQRWHIPPAVGLEGKVHKSQTVLWAEQFEAYQKTWNRHWR